MFKNELDILKKELSKHDKWFIILIGTPLSGKSTFTKLFSELGFTYDTISKDNLIESKYPNMSYNDAFESLDWKEHREIYKEYRTQFRNNIENGDNFIIDMTNINSVKRAGKINDAKEFFSVAIKFPIISEDEFKIRNYKRTESGKTISIETFNFFKDSMEDISKHEKFDLIIEI
jgi:predicted kinase